MQYTDRYHTVLGEILLAADDRGLTGLWFYGQKYFASVYPLRLSEVPSPTIRFP